MNQVYRYLSGALNALVVASVVCLAGCNVTLGSLESGVKMAAGKDLLAINTAIAKAEPSVAAFIQKHLKVADGYFQDIAKTGILSDAAIQSEAAAMVSAQKLAGSLPTNAPGVAAILAQAFTEVQTLSTP